MPALGELLVAVVMVVGIAGVVVPVLPGLFLVWAAGIVWVWLDGGGAARIVVGVLLTGLLVVGTVAKYVLPEPANANKLGYVQPGTAGEVIPQSLQSQQGFAHRTAMTPPICTGTP